MRFDRLFFLLYDHSNHGLLRLLNCKKVFLILIFLLSHPNSVLSFELGEFLILFLELYLQSLELFALLSLSKRLFWPDIADAFEKSGDSTIGVARIALGGKVRGTKVGKLLQWILFKEWLDVATLRVFDAVIALHARDG